MQRRWVAGIIISLLVVVGGLWAIYSYADPEKLELDQAVRESVPGNFVLLSKGYTHYEIGGPANGRIVVLAAGFSVPSGFLVLRVTPRPKRFLCWW